MDGLLIIDKPAGWTSHDVVARVRRLTGVRRVGHAGTLDPLATGVLPLGIGLGTRVLEYVSDADKEYTATVRLGLSTDTYDAAGAVTATGDWSAVTPVDVRRALAAFVGAIEQRPPVYSAIKRDGVPLHRLARAGRAVEAPTRRVTVRMIEPLRIELPDVDFRIRCSKGTYVRSLAHDLGIALGCFAHLTALRRTITGGFSIAQALTLTQWQQSLADGSWPAHLLPLDAPLLDRPALILDRSTARRLADGVPPPPEPAMSPARELCRAYTEEGYLAAVLRGVEADQRWRVEKVFVSPSHTSQNTEET